MSLQQFIVPQTLFAWMRVRIASSLATDGLEWSKTMGMHNSGTYNKCAGRGATHLHGGPLLVDEAIQDGREHRLSGLHDVREGGRTKAHREDRAEVADRVQEGNHLP